MTLLELSSSSEVQSHLRNHRNAVVTFSAHWCGPCKASKPALEQLAKNMSQNGMDVSMGIVYEEDLGETLMEYKIRAFPTHVLYQNEREMQRIEGANIPAVQAMIEQQCVKSGGATLGGLTASSPQQARAARLAKLSASPPPPPAATTTTTTSEPMEVVVEGQEPQPLAAEATAIKSPPPNDVEDVEMIDDPTANLNAELVQTLTESMGFALVRAQKGLLRGNGTVEGAVEWLMEHQDDADIDDPITTANINPQSYKCNQCGKVLSNLANLELHANKTGHSDFAESTESVVPLTEEEKALKIAEIKELLRAKRAEREEAEKVDQTEREIQRRFMAKEMAKTKEQLDAEQRKREVYLRKKEKEDSKKERERLRQELAKDKAERKTNHGKLSSKLGVDGYNPDAIQYDVGGDETVEPRQKKTSTSADASKIDEYIEKVKDYKAGGDGGQCLKVLKAYVGNVVDHPDEIKFKTIKMDNKAYKAKVKPFVGAKNLLLAVGFKQAEGAEELVLGEDSDPKLLADTKAKLEAALKAYG